MSTSTPLGQFGRFAEPAMLILVSLLDGPKHGYAIMTEAESLGGVPLGAGTLYAALARLEEAGLIEAIASDDRRRPYRLTGLGATSVEAQLRAMEGFARLGLKRLRDAP